MRFSELVPIRLQELNQLLRRLETILRLLLQQPHDRLGEKLGNAVINLVGFSRFVAGYAKRHGQRVLVVEGRPPDGHRIHDAAQREQVGSLIHLVAANLFGRHERRRAHGEFRLGQLGVFQRDSGQAEVR